MALAPPKDGADTSSMTFTGADSLKGHVVALLGPTNTGKTHLAVQTMLRHSSGIIGFPLRLLAREVYDRVAAEVGRSNVALVTGEEKIIPPNPHYFLCTVEAMPVGRSYDFVAVDEIQLAADPERGHVFTDRLLNARGTETTMFLGSETARPLIQRMLPDAMMTGRARLSTLSYAGKTKLSRLPRRSAVVAFSATDVYAIAELMRRQRGGAAVVLGALSPRTRNAQVEMYQAGEVDFLVATDAIGMGLNMDIDHVAFAADRKFDGHRRRSLTPAEMGQIAGRAGRFMRDGNFGVTADVEDLDEELVSAIENHRFEDLKQFRWRSARLNYDNPRALLRSLESPPPFPWLAPPRQPEDLMSLKALLKDEKVQALAEANREHLILLWDVCQIPDFRKTMHDSHVRLLGHIFDHLTGNGVIGRDWMARQLDHLDRVDGDLDTLQSRLAHVRTWTYISHRAAWLDDPAEWQGRARAIEDRLSDALHATLTQRFVDRRTAALVKKLRDADEVDAAIDAEGNVTVESQFVGCLNGLRFVADRSALDNKAMKTAVRQVLAGALSVRAKKIAQAGDDEFALNDDATISWHSETIARLIRGQHVLAPEITLISGNQLGRREADRLKQRLEAWLKKRIGSLLRPLVGLEDAPFSPQARGVAYQLVENLGILPRDRVADHLRQFDAKDYGRFKYRGVQLGHSTIYCPALLKPESTRWRQILHDCGKDDCEPLDLAGLVSIDIDKDADHGRLLRAGYRSFGKVAVRVDMLERISALAHRSAKKGEAEADHEMLSLLGGGVEQLVPVLTGLGFVTERQGEDSPLKYRARGRRAKPKNQRRRKPSDPVKNKRPTRIDPHSPFAALMELRSK
ncbi:MAG: helicase-related protein [Minwuia sp.]|uniref:helicase-related protein n=1 Tax=Minwuia sp. TaxID=2493630 RepID=UPI003A843A38